MKNNSRWLRAKNEKKILIFAITILFISSGMDRLYEPSIVLGQENVLCGKISAFTFDPICPSTGIKFWITIVSLESCDGQVYTVDYSLADYDGKYVIITNPIFGYFEQWCPDWDPSYGILGWSKVEAITSCNECKSVPPDGGGGSETQYAYVVIYANVAEYEIWVDGNYYFTEGHPPPGASSTSPKPDGICRFPVTPGSHTITLTKDGCEPYTFHVSINAGEEKEFHVTMNCRETYGHIWIYANVAEYEVWVDGNYILTEGHGTGSSTSPKPDGICRFPVTPGSHTITLTKDGCEPYTFHVSINAGEEKEFHVTMNCREECENPSPPSLISPSKNSSPDQPVLFSWESVNEATSYRIQVSTNSQFSSLLINTTVSRTTYQSSQSFSPGTYYWRVKAINDCGESDWSNTWSFTIECEKPPSPELLSPRNNATATPPVTFSWEASEGATLYRFEISVESSMGSLIFNTSVSGTYFEIDDETYPFQEDTYYWRVIPENSCGRGEPSAIYSFTVGCKRPSTPKLELPSNGSKTKSPVEFSWKPVDNEKLYRIQISTDSNFGSIVYDEKVSGRYSANLENGTYYWRVKALNDCGESDWSEIWRFVIGDGNSPPIIEKVTISPDYVDIAGSLIIDIWASDPDGDELQFFFEPEVGEVCCLTKNSDYAVQNYGEGNYSATLLLRVGIEPGTYTLKVIASDGEFEDSDIATYSVITGYDQEEQGELNARLIIDNGEEKTNGRRVVLTIISENAKQMRLRNDGEGWSEWMFYSSNMAWNLRDEEGERAVYVEVKDKNGNVASSEDSIFYEKRKKGIVITDVHLPTDLVSSDVENRQFMVYKLTFKVKNLDDKDLGVNLWVSSVTSYFYDPSLIGFSKNGHGLSIIPFLYGGKPTLEPDEEKTIMLDIFFASAGQYDIEIGAGGNGSDTVFVPVYIRNFDEDNQPALHRIYQDIYLDANTDGVRNSIAEFLAELAIDSDETRMEGLASGALLIFSATNLITESGISPVQMKDIQKCLNKMLIKILSKEFILRIHKADNPIEEISREMELNFQEFDYDRRIDEMYETIKEILMESHFSEEGKKRLEDVIDEYSRSCDEICVYESISGFQLGYDSLRGADVVTTTVSKVVRLSSLGIAGALLIAPEPTGVSKLAAVKVALMGGAVAQYSMDAAAGFLHITSVEKLYRTSSEALCGEYGCLLGCYENTFEKLLDEVELIAEDYSVELSYIDIDTIRDSGTTISGGSPVDFVIIDQQERIVGLKNGIFAVEIPGTSIFSLGEKEEYVLPSNGEYEINLMGKGSGEYHLNISQPTTIKTTDGIEYKTKTEINISGTTKNHRIQTFNYDLNQIASQVSQEFSEIVQERGLTEIDETTRQQIINESIQRVVSSIDSDGDGIPDVEDRTPVPSKFDWRGFFVINIRKYSSFMLIFLFIGIIGILGTFAYSRMGRTTRIQVLGFGEIGTLKSISREAKLIVSGNEFWIEKSYITIGRSEDADIRITDSDKLISDIHAEVYKDETGQYWVKDSSSANGTFIHRNGKYIKMRNWALYDGDKIGLCYDSQRRKVVPIIFKITKKSEEEIDGKMIKETDAKIIIEGRRIPLTKESITIGKGEEADIRITDSDIAVSEIHSRIYKDEKGQYWIEDKNSGNGTFIYLFGEYRRIKMWRLYDGDIIGLCYDPAAGKQYPIIFERSKRYERRFLKSPILWDIFSES